VNHLVNTPENVDNLKKLWIVNAKAKSILKRSLFNGLFEHIIGCKSVGEIWTNLNGLLNKKDVARLQLLENVLANTTQGDLSIS
jgi:hypothetical protein